MFLLLVALDDGRNESFLSGEILVERINIFFRHCCDAVGTGLAWAFLDENASSCFNLARRLSCEIAAEWRSCWVL
ncbi:hypothetical protein [Paraburkholderia sp. J12]|uniref:hypothetical protein n=1 Tax=Paraburkholderia sp. J12 TaxID=2805432 RepID=UPI002ABE262F|nr:hypothetical protein [Paraburkholderia sp. J12]